MVSKMLSGCFTDALVAEPLSGLEEGGVTSLTSQGRSQGSEGRRELSET